METRFWTTVDKSSWGPGDWQAEPDKMQFPDAATGLPCLVKRGPTGALCGYVGVPEGHPWYLVNYNDMEYYPDVHGGLTFSDLCDPSEDEANAICHVPGPGEPDHVWWLGFDCAHSGDLAPVVNMGLAALTTVTDAITGYRYGQGYTYKTLAYVQGQCAQLARQIANATN